MKFSTTETRYGVGEGGEGLLIGFGGSGDTAVDVTYQTEADGSGI